MEIFLVLMFCVLFLEYGGDAKKDFFKLIINNKKGVLKYFGSAMILAVTLSALPYIFLSIYMRQHGFFAFEMFGSQEAGVRIISFNVFFNFFLLSVLLVGAAILWKLKAPWFLVLILFFVTLVTVLLLLFVAYKSGSFDLLVAVLFVSILIGSYFYFWVSNSVEGKVRRWWVPLGFSAAALILPVIFHSYAAALTGSALFQMRVGGMPVKLSSPLDFNGASVNGVVKGKLLLRTPELYYVRVANSKVSGGYSIFIVSAEAVSIKYVFDEM